MSDFTTGAWDGNQGRWPDADSYCASCLVDDNPAGQPKTKSNCHFPVTAPGTKVYNVTALRTCVAYLNKALNSPGGGTTSNTPMSVLKSALSRVTALLTEYAAKSGG